MRRLIILILMAFPIFGIAQDSSAEDDPIFLIVEQMPEFNGGEEGMQRFMTDNLIYIKSAKEAGVKGTVYVEFVVKGSGKVDGIRINRGLNKELDAEVLRVIKAMPAWKAGRMNGKPVNVRMVLPVKFGS